MYGLVIGIALFVCVLLILIVLVQNPKGGGLASSFSSSNQFMGVKRTADFVEKATWGFAAALFLLCVLATVLPHKGGAMRQPKIMEQIDNSAIDPQQMPTYPTTAPASQSNETPQQTPPAGNEQPATK